MKNDVTGGTNIFLSHCGYMLVKAEVKTGKKKFHIEKGETWLISVKAPAKRNMANAEIVRELSKIYENVKIIKGAKSAKKLIFLGNSKP
jgi:uncharacterized protein (TIGR00251 family)